MEFRPTLNDGIELQDAGSETLVHDPRSRRIHVLNPEAATILRACDGEHSVEELATLLHAPEAERARADAVAIVEQFSELGLIR